MKLKILIAVLLFIILGMLIMRTKEGFDAADAPGLASNLGSSMNKELVAAGLPAIDINAAGDLFKQLQDLIGQQVAVSQGTYDTVTAAEASDPSNNTVAIDLSTPKSFLYGDKMSGAFCKQKKNCASLREENCNTTDCCVWLNGKKCVPGNVNGPTIAINSDVDYYLYKYQCYGDKCVDGNSCLKYANADKNLTDNCLVPMWKKAGCTTALPDSTWWKTQTKADVKKDMNAWALMPDYSHRSICYGNDRSKWPSLDSRYKRVYGNSGAISCSQYCNKTTGGKTELPNSWKGSICAAAGQNDDNDCSYVPGTGATNLQCICQRSDVTPWVE